jgi:phosphonate transport system permease protein
MLPAARNLPFAIDYVSKMVPPDFSVLPSLWGPLLETLRMAIVGTITATVLALPISFLAAQNTTPCIAVLVVVRGLLSFLRSMPEMVWALLFVSLSGLGMLAGVLGITCHTVGAMGKMFFECIESSVPKMQSEIEAMRLDGAAELQVIRYGILPEIMPLVASYTLYRFESTIRTSTIMGLVGAGGLGLELTMAVRMFRRQEALAIILLIVVLVACVDWASGRIRRHILQESGYA